MRASGHAWRGLTRCETPGRRPRQQGPRVDQRRCALANRAVSTAGVHKASPPVVKLSEITASKPFDLISPHPRDECLRTINARELEWPHRTTTTALACRAGRKGVPLAGRPEV